MIPARIRCRAQTLSALASLGLLLAVVPAPLRAVSVEPVALSGDPAPGLGGGSFAGFYRPKLSEGGALAFAAYTTGSPGVWTRPAGGGPLQLEAQVGEPRPEFGPGATLYEVEALEVDDAGNATLVGRVQGLPVGNGLSGTVLWLPDGSGGHAVALKSGDPAPGIPDATLFYLREIRVGDSGELSFRATLAGPGYDAISDDAIWVPDGAGHLLVVQRGDPVPGFAPYTFFPSEAKLNAAGDVATIIGGGLAVFSTRGPGTFDSLFEVGDPAPGAPGGAAFSDFDWLLLNGAGELAIQAKAADGSFGGIWVSDAAENLELRAGPGDPLPGAPGVQMAGEVLLAFNDAGDVAFRTILSGVGVSTQNDVALVGPDGAGGMHVIYREGDEIAGLPGGVMGIPQQVLLNAAGDAVILAQVGVSGDPGAPGNSLGLGLLVAPAGGGLHLVAIQGQPFEVAPGDVRTMSAFGEWDLHTNFIQLLPGSLSDDRTLAFEASFIDGNEYSGGLFLVTIPEPGTALLLLGGLLGFAAAARARRTGVGGYSA